VKEGRENEEWRNRDEIQRVAPTPRSLLEPFVNIWR